MKAAKARRLGVNFISHELPDALRVTNRIVVQRLGTIVRETPPLESTGESPFGTITGLHAATESFPAPEESRIAVLARRIN